MIRVAARTLTGLALTAAVADASARTPKPGDAAPPYQLVTIDGEKISSDELKGQVVVLNFWATWCAPCKRELPTLDAFYEVMKVHGLRVFAVTTEDSLQPSQLKPLFKAMHLTPVRRIKGPYGVLQGVPTNYVIGRDGRVRYAKAAAFDLDDLNREIVPLLNEPAPAAASPAAAPAS